MTDRWIDQQWHGLTRMCAKNTAILGECGADTAKAELLVLK